MFASLLFLALGQVSQPETTPALKLPLIPVCLTRTVTDAEGGTHPFPIVVRQGALGQSTVARFTPIACLATGLEAVRYRTEVCRLAGLGNSAVQARLEYILGAPPKALCTEANAFGSLLTTILTLGH